MAEVENCEWTSDTFEKESARPPDGMAINPAAAHRERHLDLVLTEIGRR
jgi:hypothetical protein